MVNNLRITNMVMTGNMPFEHRLNEREMERLIMKGSLRCIDIQDKPMRISADVEKEGITAHGKRKRANISVWPKGAINIMGITKKKEADEIYERVFNDIKRLCPRVLKNVH